MWRLARARQPRRPGARAPRSAALLSVTSRGCAVRGEVSVTESKQLDHVTLKLEKLIRFSRRMLGASSFYLLTFGSRALNGPWRHGPRRRLGFRSLMRSLPPTRARGQRGAFGRAFKRGERVRGVGALLWKLEGIWRFSRRAPSQSKCRYFRNLLERGGSIQKSRPRRLSTRKSQRYRTRPRPWVQDLCAASTLKPQP